MITRGELLMLGISAGVTGGIIGGLLLGRGLALVGQGGQHWIAAPRPGRPDQRQL